MPDARLALSLVPKPNRRAGGCAPAARPPPCPAPSPIGIQTLPQIRTEGYCYVDKSGFAVRLATTGKYFFLLRPRRFGKSLFLDTLAELLGGNHALFAGLAA